MSVIGANESGSKFYKAEKILKRRNVKGEKFYRIQWVECPMEEASCGPTDNISPHLVEEFKINEKMKKGNDFLRKYWYRCRNEKLSKCNRKSWKRRKKRSRSPSDSKVGISKIGTTIDNEITSTSSNHCLSEADIPTPTMCSTSQISSGEERKWELSLEDTNNRISSLVNASTQTSRGHNAMRDNYEITDIRALFGYDAEHYDDLISTAGTLSIIGNKWINSNPDLEEISLNHPTVILSSRGRIPGNIGGIGGARFNEVNRGKAPSHHAVTEPHVLPLHKEVGHDDLLPTVEPVNHENEPINSVHISEETNLNPIPMVDLTLIPLNAYERVESEGNFEDKDTRINGPVIETAVNSSRGLFSTSEESEAMETDETLSIGSRKPHSNQFNAPERILECVLREVKDSDGSISFRVKWQDTEIPERVSEKEMTKYALKVFEYYRRRISELKAFLGRNWN